MVDGREVKHSEKEHMRKNLKICLGHQLTSIAKIGEPHEYQSRRLRLRKHHFTTSLEGLDMLLQGHWQQTPPTTAEGIFRKDFHHQKQVTASPSATC